MFMHMYSFCEAVSLPGRLLGVLLQYTSLTFSTDFLHTYSVHMRSVFICFWFLLAPLSAALGEPGTSSIL